MKIDDERIAYAVIHTKVLRPPRQTLATFGNTSIRYFVLTEPSYNELVKESGDIVIREGRVIAEKPKVVTPSYLIKLEGFGDNARRCFRQLIAEEGPHTPGILYQYSNQPKGLSIVSGDIMSVMERIEKDIKGDPLTAIIQGVDELWDVSLLKFIRDMTNRSVEGNLMELGGSGLVSVDSSGVTGDARRGIDGMFRAVKMNREDPERLKEELDRWDVFHEYEDKFLDLFR